MSQIILNPNDCYFCGISNPDKYCENCELQMCFECETKIHKSNIANRQHVIRYIENPWKLQKHRMCTFHKHEELRFFCNTDHEIVCQDCISVGAHKGHNHQTLESTEQKFHGVSQLLFKKLSMHLNEQVLETKQIQSKFKAVQEQIQSIFHVFSRCLDNKINDLNQIIDQIFELEDEHTKTQNDSYKRVEIYLKINQLQQHAMTIQNQDDMIIYKAKHDFNQQYQIQNSILQNELTFEILQPQYHYQINNLQERLNQSNQNLVKSKGLCEVQERQIKILQEQLANFKQKFSEKEEEERIQQELQFLQELEKQRLKLDVFDKNYYKISKDGQSIGRIGQIGYFNAFSSLGYTSGKWKWNYKIIKSHQYMYIGVCSDNTMVNDQIYFCSKVNGYGLRDDGNIYNDGIFKKYSDKYSQGDLVQIELNLNDMELSFSKNGKSYGIAFKNLPKVMYYLAICIYYTGDVIQGIN